MSVKISGVMKDAMGKPIPDCTIALKALHTTATVITKTVGSLQPEENGSYSMDVELGKYSVTLCVEGYQPNDVGEIYVHSESAPGTLNYYLGLPTEGDLPPAAIQQFEAMVELVSQQAAQVEKDKAAADVSAKAAKLSETNAKTSETNAGKSAAAALVSEKAAKTSETNTAKGIEAAAASAQAAKLSENNADGSKKAAQASAAEALASQGDAKTSETNAGNSAKAASGSADKAKSEADRATTATDGKQDKNALLTAIAALNTAADQIITLTGKNSVATAVLTKFAKEMLAKTDAAGVREYLGLKEALIKGDYGVGSKSDYLPASLNGASGFFGAGSYAVGTSAAVVVQSSYGAERRGQLAVNMANEAFFRFCNSASESATTHPWKKIAAHGDTNVSFGSGFEVANKVGAGYIVFNVVNNARPITDNGCKFAIEIPNSTERPYMLQRKNDGTTAGQIVNQLPVSSGQIAIQGTSGREYKKDVVDADGTEALNRINELRLVNYIYIDDEKGRLRFGFIAEEAEIIAPQYIKHMQEPIDEIADPDSGEVIDRIYRDRPCVDNNPIVMDLLGAIQALTSKVNEQDARLLTLEKTTSNRKAS